MLWNNNDKCKLNSIILNEPITFYNHHNIIIVPTKVENENQLVNS